MSHIPQIHNVTTSPKADFCLQFGLSHFQKSITNNFTLINEIMTKQQEEISMLKNKYQQLVDAIMNNQFQTKPIKQDRLYEQNIQKFKKAHNQNASDEKQILKNNNGTDSQRPVKPQQQLMLNKFAKQQFSKQSVDQSFPQNQQQTINKVALKQSSKQVQIQTISQKEVEDSFKLKFMKVRKIPMQQLSHKEGASTPSQHLLFANHKHTEDKFKQNQMPVNLQHKIENSSRDMIEVKTQPNLSKGKKSILSNALPKEAMPTEETASIFSNSIESMPINQQHKQIVSNKANATQPKQPKNESQKLSQKLGEHHQTEPLKSIESKQQSMNKKYTKQRTQTKQQEAMQPQLTGSSQLLSSSQVKSNNSIHMKQRKPIKSISTAINVTEEQLINQQQLNTGQIDKQNLQQIVPSTVISNPMMEAKVFQLFQRVRLLEEKQLTNNHQNLKRFKEIEFTLEGNSKFLQKNANIEKKFEQEVQRLRNQLSEYKLKKQAKLMKAINSNSLNQSGSSGDSLDYIAQKLQFLLKHTKQLLPRHSYEEDRVIMEQQIQNLRLKVNKNISQQLFNDKLKNLQLKIYQNIVQYMSSKMGGQSTFNSESGGTVLEEFIARGNNQFYQKVDEHSQKLNQLQNDIDLLKANTEMNRKQRLLFQTNINQEFANQIERTNVLEHRAQNIEQQIQSSNQRFNLKQSEAEDQIAQSQELIDQLTQRMKSITLFSRPSDSNQVPLNNQTDILNEPGQRGSIQIENDLQTQKKKLAKLISKVQGIKEDVLTVREDMMREIDGLKMNMEKKADWESFKKTLSYFDQKMKETKIMIQAVASSMQTNEGGDSLAAKRSWTCLVCDKQIKNYEGKLSQVKFTSMFPIRESPRIGGYYKQQQTGQQYKQVYLNNSPVGNVRAHRRASLKPVNQKQQEQK